MPSAAAALVNGLPDAAVFWHGKDRKWVYSCPLGPSYEITCSIKEIGGERGSWGRRGDVAAFQQAFSEMCQPVQELLKLATYVEQYDYFAGPRLASVVQQGIALVGDASHPLSGAFGAGAGFALEDAWVLGRAVAWARARGEPLHAALDLFDAVRSPHYADLYAVLDGYKATDVELTAAQLSPAEEIRQVVARNWSDRTRWMLFYQVEGVLEREIARRDAEGGEAQASARENGHQLDAATMSGRQLNPHDVDAAAGTGRDLPAALHAVRVA